VRCIQVRPIEVMSALLASDCFKYRNRSSELLWLNQIKLKSNTSLNFCGSGCVIPTIKRKDEGKVTNVTIYYVNNTT
jgi:hypothetical protein